MTTAEIREFIDSKMDEFIAAWMNDVKTRAGYVPEVTVYDGEIRALMEAGVTEMLTAGVPEELFATENIDKRIINGLALYVLGYIEQDRTDTKIYLDLFRKTVFKLSMEDGGGWDVE